MSTSVNTNALTLLRKLGEELRRIRLEAGYRKQVDVAEILGCSQGKISYVERGKRWPDTALLRGMFEAYKVDEVKRAEIEATVSAGRSIRNWWDEPEFRELFSGDARKLFPLEDSAEKIWVHSGTYVPGLLQTRAYIEALAEFGQKDESALHRERFVKARVKRQEVLTRQRPVLLNALVLEAALRTVVGGPEVMKQQLQYLRQMTGHTHVTLRAIPYSAGAAAAIGTPFMVFDFPGSEDLSVASRETTNNDDVTDDPFVVRQTRRKFADLAGHALSPTETTSLLEEIEKAL
ncbi:helix-turn-helix domain-containing protein [Streptomyces daliensis]|uniref:Helix-turn-helix domain-containing protein n=1 Tax=Streptomyces daliensis TaxID=299421 RepID=A0A8T4IUI6_9ACTN|nr:helix-turn-helix domain-containing protein [Streptomyces daliensis]